MFLIMTWHQHNTVYTYRAARVIGEGGGEQSFIVHMHTSKGDALSDLRPDRHIKKLPISVPKVVHVERIGRSSIAEVQSET